MKKTIFAALAVAAGLGLAASEAWAVNFTVTKTADTADGVCDADCSLREAITASNATTTDDTITLQPLTTYSIQIGSNCEDANADGDFDITTATAGKTLTINGGGAGSTVISGAALDRVFDLVPQVGVTPTVIINGVTIKSGAP